jgi:hypothetical protein
VRAPVAEICVNDSGAAVGVTLRGRGGNAGETIRCSTVVSSVGAATTFGRLIPAAHRGCLAEPLAALGAWVLACYGCGWRSWDWS